MLRQDDQGNQFLIDDHLSEDQARELVAEFEASGHKQMYWAEPMIKVGRDKPAVFQKAVMRIVEEGGLAPDMVSFVRLSELNAEQIDCAVLFCHALWSGPSKEALTTLARALAEKEARLPLLVIDSDELSSGVETVKKAQSLFGPLLGGWGETCWIKHGAVIERRAHCQAEVVRQLIAELGNPDS